MRKMFSKNQIEKVANEQLNANVVEALKGKDIQIEGLTSKGIANTGGLANIGNVAVSGDLNASGAITGGSIIETMSGYTLTKISENVSYYYAGVVKNGNKITFVVFGKINLPATSVGYEHICDFYLPNEVMNELYPYHSTFLAFNRISVFVGTALSGEKSVAYNIKKGTNYIEVNIERSPLLAETDYNFRIEQTFLLSENLAEQE